MNSRREFIQNTLLASVACGAATEAVAQKSAVKEPSTNANPLIYPMRPMKAGPKIKVSMSASSMQYLISSAV